MVNYNYLISNADNMSDLIKIKKHIMVNHSYIDIGPTGEIIIYFINPEYSHHIKHVDNKLIEVENRIKNLN